MAKSFDDLVKQTSTANSKDIAAKRIKELLKDYNVNKITWLDLYNFLYNKAHDLNHLGSFNWDAEVTVLNPETGEQFGVESKIFNKNQAELFCNPALILKLND